MFEKRVLYFLLLLGSVLYGIYVSQNDPGFLGQDSQASSNIVGQKAPDFTLVDESGKVLKLSSLKGKTILLHFWATWCPPCANEFPILSHFVSKITNSDFVFIALSLDDVKSDVVDFRKTTKFDFPVYFDPEEGAIADKYGTYKLPETYLIDKTGTIVKKMSGPQDWSLGQWKTLIDNVMR